VSIVESIPIYKSILPPSADYSQPHTGISMVKNKQHLHSRLHASYIVYGTEGILSGEIRISETINSCMGPLSETIAVAWKSTAVTGTHTGGIYSFNQNIKAPCRILCLSNLNPILHM
jgi:hypothetical protein